MASMGPRTLVRGNVQLGVGITQVNVLQWGRALSCAEIDVAHLADDLQTGFNGAAHSRARKCNKETAKGKEMESLQWGRALSCAEMIYADHAYRFASCFNGAAHSRAR